MRWKKSDVLAKNRIIKYDNIWIIDLDLGDGIEWKYISSCLKGDKDVKVV